MSSIITIDDLTGYTAKSLTPTVAQQVVDAVNAWIESKTNRCWGETRTADERYDWQRVLWLRHQDVQTITSVKAGYPGQAQQTCDPGWYYVNPLGRLTFYSSAGYGTGMVGALGPNTAYNDWLEITYVYGVTVVPDDLVLAALGVASVNDG